MISAKLYLVTGLWPIPKYKRVSGVNFVIRVAELTVQLAMETVMEYPVLSGFLAASFLVTPVVENGW